MAGKFGRFNVMRKMVVIEEGNVGIAVATARLHDEYSGHFSPQKSVKIKRHGYRCITENNQNLWISPELFRLFLAKSDVKFGSTPI